MRCNKAAVAHTKGIHGALALDGRFGGVDLSCGEQPQRLEDIAIVALLRAWDWLNILVHRRKLARLGVAIAVSDVLHDSSDACYAVLDAKLDGIVGGCRSAEKRNNDAVPLSDERQGEFWELAGSAIIGEVEDVGICLERCGKGHPKLKHTHAKVALEIVQ